MIQPCGVIGLGKMGLALAKKLSQVCTVIGYDVDPVMRQQLYSVHNCAVTQTLDELIQQVAVFWIMVPAPHVQQIVDEIIQKALQSSLIIDGGNSHFAESVARYQQCKVKGHGLLDCGTSGGLWSVEHGFCCMVGGDVQDFYKAEPYLKAVAVDAHAYAHVGPAGAGHYVKMVHNGIEYALMQAYADGFNLLRNGQYDQLDLAQISQLWMHGAVVRSFLLELITDIFEQDQQLTTIAGIIQETGMGAWTVQEAQQQQISVPAIQKALEVRAASRQGQRDFATKLIAVLRNKMGGHAV